MLTCALLIDGISCSSGFADGIPEATFATIKARLHDKYSNRQLSPDNLTSMALLAVLQPTCRYTVVAEKMAFLEKATLDDVVQYAKTLFSKVALKAMAVGNVTTAEATSIVEMVSVAMGSPPTCSPAEIDVQVPLQLTELDAMLTAVVATDDAAGDAAAATTAAAEPPPLQLVRVPVLVQRNCNPDDSNGLVNNTYQFELVRLQSSKHWPACNETTFLCFPLISTSVHVACDHDGAFHLVNC